MSIADQNNFSMKTPEWLEALENKRKRSHKLAHEIGAGAPCLICKDGCKGLHLHFWRKLCIECKCRKEDHEIEEEEDNAQFEILFGAKKVKRTMLRFNAQNKSFDWIPPDIPLELAVDYLNSIPQSKVPISNSEGARYRKQQLEKQIPLHDVDPCVCHNLTEIEKNEFKKYLDNLKNNVIGQGKIMKFNSHKNGMIKENLTHVPSINSMVATEEYNSKMKPLAAQLQSCLTINKVPEFKASSQSLNLESSIPETLSKNNLPQKDPLQVKSISPKKNQNVSCNNKDLNLKGQELKFQVPKPYSNNNREINELKSSNDKNVLDFKIPSSFIKQSNNLLNDKQNNNSELSHEDKNYNEKVEKLLEKSNQKTSFSEMCCANSLNLKSNENILTNPCNATFCKDYLNKFKSFNVCSKEVPFTTVQESDNLSRQLITDPMSKQEQDNLEDNLNSFPTPPSTCQECLQILYPEDVVVQTERSGNLAFWHAKCFICETCKELLVDLMYFFYKGKVYCGRHYAEITNIPRCFACDELIFVKEYTCAEGKSYHVRHFCCFSCDQPLGGKQYIPKDNQPICLKCFQNKFGKTCQTCSMPIAAGEQRVSWKHLDYHVSSECFRCACCFRSLLGGRFVVKNDKTFCSKECTSNVVE